MNEPRTNLLVMRSAFFGRAEELAHLEGALAEGSRLVTLAGTPGIGKSRLARELTRRVLDVYGADGGAWFCDLTRASTAAKLVDVVATVLGVTVRDDAHEGLGHALASRGAALLVLDNFDELGEDARSLVEAWLDAAPLLQIVATSRAPLGLALELVVRVGPLPFEAGALELLTDRTRQRRRDFVVTASARELLAGIAASLEGNPLALELVSHRIAAEGVKAVSRAASGAGPVFDGTERAALVRTVGTSWTTLGADRQELLAALSVFPGAFDADAATAAAGVPAEARALLDDLVERALVHAVGDDRYALYMSVQEYARDRLRDAGGERAAVERHAAHFAALVREHHARSLTRGGASARRRLLAERENILVAMERTDLASIGVTLADAAELLRRTGGSSSRLARALERTELLDGARVAPGPLGRLLLLRSDLLVLSGARADVQRLAEEARTLAADAVDLVLQARAAIACASLHWAGGELGRAEADARAAVALAERSGDHNTEVEARTLLSLVLLIAKRAGDARAEIERAERLVDDATDARWITRLQMSRARLVAYEGDFIATARENAEAAERARAAGDVTDEAMAVASAGAASAILGEVDLARARLDRAIDLLDRAGSLTGGTHPRGVLGVVEWLRGEPLAARARLTDVVASFRRLGHDRSAGIYRAYVRAISVELEAPSEPDLEPLADASSQTIQGVLEHVARLRGLAGDARVAAATWELGELARLFEGPGAPSYGVDARLAVTAARAALQRIERGGELVPDVVDGILVLDRGAAFRVRSSPRVDLTTRGVLAPLFRALVRRRLERPGEPVSKAELRRAGWDDAGPETAAAVNRLRVAMTTLRGLGLGPDLVAQGGGYLIHPALDIVER